MPIVQIPDIGPVKFPDDFSSEDIEKAAGELYDQNRRATLDAIAPGLSANSITKDIKVNFPESPINQQVRRSELMDQMTEVATTVPQTETGGAASRMQTAFARGSAQLYESFSRALGSAADWISSSPAFAVFRGPATGRVLQAAESTGEFLTEKANEARQGIVKDLSLIEQATPTNPIGELAATVAGGAPSLAPTIATAPIGGLPILMAGIQTYGSVLGSAEEGYRSQGLSEDEVRDKARKVAALNGLGTALLTFGFNRFGPGLEKWNQGLGNQSTKQAIRKIANDFGFEATEEGIDQLTQGITARATYDPNKSWDSIIKESLEAGLTGGIIAAGAKGVAIADQNLQLYNEMSQADPEFSARSKTVADETALLASLPPKELPSNPVAAKAEVSGAPATAAAVEQSAQILGAAKVPEKTSIKTEATVTIAPETTIKKPTRVSVEDADAIEQQAIEQERQRNAIQQTTSPVLPNVQTQPGEVQQAVPAETGIGENVAASAQSETTPSGGSEIISGVTDNVKSVAPITFSESIANVPNVTNEQLVSHKGENASGATGYMWDLGSKAKTPEDVAILRQMAEDSSVKVKNLIASGDLEGAMAIAGRQPAEAYEFATGVTLDGQPKWQTFEKRVPGYKPSVPDAQYLAAKAPNVAPSEGEAALTKPSTESGMQIGIVPPGTELTMDTIGNPNWWNKNFTSNRGLPTGVMSEWNKRMGTVRAEARMASYAARDLANALRDMYGIGRLESAAISGLSRVPKSAMEGIQNALTGGSPIDMLPEQLRAPVQAMRDHVDSLSNEISDVLGEDNPMAATIKENLGTYLNRSYRIFDDKNWLKKIPVDIRNAAEGLLAEQLAGENGEITDELRNQAKIKLQEMLADWSDSGLDKLMRSGKLGAKDVSIFMQRKDIAPEIRAVMGEYGDPVTNYVRSVTKMARWLGDSQFLKQIRELGLGHWLFKEGEAPKGFEHKIAADSSSTMYPLNGLRTSPEIKLLFEEFNKSNFPTSLLPRAYFMLNALSRQNKTVWSALTQARNFIGNPFFNIKSGHFNFTDYGKALQAQFADIVGNNEHAQNFYAEMAKYGLVDENPVVSDLKKAIEDSGLQDPAFEDYSTKGMARALRMAISAPQRAYRLPDEMGKTVGWLGEIKDLQSAHPDWTLDKVKQEAATRVRNEYPTYSMIPEALQQFRKQPLIGPFVNFAYETIRNSYHTLLNGSTDLFTGENLAQRKHGAKKLAGFSTVLASGYALGLIGRSVLQMSKNDEDDIRRFLPEWSKNSDLIFMSKDGTKSRFVNYSYLNPYNQMNDAFNAAVSNDKKGILDKSMAALGEMFRPFVNEQMLARSVADVWANKDANGKEIYNPQDDDSTKFKKGSEHIMSSLLPGTLERLKKRIVPAIMGEPTASGEKRDPALEVFSEVSGLRMDQIDILKSFGFKMRNNNESLDDARKLASSVILSPKSYTQQEAIDAYKKADDARFNIWKDMYKDASALIRQGATVKDIRDAMKSSHFSSKDVNRIISGGYVPMEFKASDFTKIKKLPDSELLSAIAIERSKRMAMRLDR